MARRRREFGAIRKLTSGRYQARWWDETRGAHVPAPQTFATRAEAAAWLAEAQSGVVDTAKLRDRGDPLEFAQFARDWITTRPLGPQTRILYRSQLRRHLLPTFGVLALDEITAPIVRRWYARQVRSGLSRVTVAKQYRLLRSILGTAVDEELILRNPCQIKGGGTERSPERAIPGFEVVRNLADAMPDHLALVPWIAALAGLRKGEMLALARRHIDIDTSTIRVERALLEVRGEGAVFAEPKSAAGVRTVTMPGTLAALVDEHLDEHVADDPDALLFANGHGNPIRASVWTPAWAAARKGAGVDVRLHDLRHLAGTLTAQAGATLRETMDRLGHSSPQAALRYQHVAASRPGKIASAIEDLIAEAGEEAS